MTKAGKWTLVGFVVAIVGTGVAGAGVLVAHGVSARDEPTKMEAWIAGVLRHLAVPRRDRDAKNPIALTPEVLDAAREHFADHCAVCHANDGSGDTTIGKNLYPKAPDMRLARTQSLSDGEIFWIIENGVRLTGMPGWGTGAHADQADSWKLVHFIRHLTQMNTDEMEKMKAWNPVSPQEFKEQKEEEQFLDGTDDAEGSPETKKPAAPVVQHAH